MARSKRSAAPYVPDSSSLTRLRAAAAHCHGCDLYKHAIQTVFGEGKVRARAMFVGEVPGDVEDKAGHPFVGPAGQLLRRAMRAAGISLRDVYLTNAVKHFKYIWRGKRRIHVKPKRIEVQACRPWLEAELWAVKPHVLVALGAVAAQALLGSSFRVTKQRGQLIASDLAPHVMATVHPSAILRSPDAATRRREVAEFTADLKRVAQAMRSGSTMPRGRRPTPR